MTRLPARAGSIVVWLPFALAALTGLVAAEPAWFSGAERWVGSGALAATHDHPWWRAFWLVDATVEHPTTFRFLLLLGAVTLALLGRWRLSVWLVVVLVASLGLAAVAKEVLQRPRPTWTHPVTAVAGYSYPSGHATAAWTAAVAAVLLSTTIVRRRSTRYAVAIIAAAAAVLVSLGRVFLGVHYPSDVVAGALLGSLVALVPWLLVVRPASWTVGRDQSGGARRAGLP